jgi:hypothetical protein
LSLYLLLDSTDLHGSGDGDDHQGRRGRLCQANGRGERATSVEMQVNILQGRSCRFETELTSSFGVYPPFLSRWFSSLLGKVSSVGEIVASLRSHDVRPLLPFLSLFPPSFGQGLVIASEIAV